METTAADVLIAALTDRGVDVARSARRRRAALRGRPSI
jgi:hypothetical protein